MAGHGEKRSRKQEAAILALLSQPSLAHAAQAAGIGERTLRRWLKDPAFQMALQEAKQALVSQALARLQAGLNEAVSVLRVAMLRADVPWPSRIQAARIWLEAAVYGTELEDMAGKVQELLLWRQEQRRETSNGVFSH